MTFTQNEQAKLGNMLGAFMVNFPNFTISKENRCFYVHRKNETPNQYVFSTTSIIELRGWMSGCIKVKNGVVR